MKKVPLFLSFFCSLFSVEHISSQQLPDKNPLKVMTFSLQERQTMKLKLKNGLEVLLISDPSANQSSAALAVEVGSWQDPKQYPGMAHFCEHMLFMGSKKYPEEDGFHQRIGDSGGSANAYTWTDRTVYGFSSNHKNFSTNLDVFAHFFIDPLFNESSVARELRAVNQEYAKNIENDRWREWQIFKELGNPDHPNSNFSTGNEETLRIIPVKTLENWYRLHYSADKMHLVVYASEPLSQLKELVHQSFSTILTTNTPPMHYDAVMSSEQKGSTLYIEPIQDIRSVSFQWEIPPEIASDLDAKIPELIAYTLSYKGENSLFEHLYKQSLVESLSADVLRMSPNQAVLVFSIDLTKKGVEHVDLIIEETFSMINSLKATKIPSHVFEEMKKLGETNYKWQQRTDEFNFAMSSASSLIDENLDTFPYKTFVIQAMKPSVITSTLATMTPAKTLITVTAPSSMTKISPDKKEKWLGGEYKIIPLQEERLDFLTTIAPNPAFAPPSPNPYIPNHLSVRKQTQKQEPIIPKLLSDDSFGKCYFLEDEHYLAPEIVMKFGFKSPAIKPTAKSFVMTDIAIELLSRKMLPVTNQAQRAGIYTSIYQDQLKLEFTVRGQDNKTHLLVLNICDGLKTLCPKKEDFELVKESLQSEYENREKQLAILRAKEMIYSILENDTYLGADLSAALTNISYEDYLQFNEELTQSSYVEAVIGGNLCESEALGYWLSLKTSLKPSPYPSSQQFCKKTLPLSNESVPYTVNIDSEMGGNAALLMIQVPTNSIAKMASQSLLAQALHSSFFDTLRTKQQTGYIARAWTEEKDQKLLFFFAVQSTTHCPSELLARFDLYLEELIRNFETEISLDRFHSLKETLITNLSKPPTNLAKKINQLYTLAYEKHGDFERRQHLIKAIESLQYTTFKEDSASFLCRQNTKRIAILIEGKQVGETPLSYRPISYKKAKSL